MEPSSSLPGLARLSPRALAALKTARAGVETIYRPGRERLAEALRARGLPVSDAVLAIEDDFGGLSSRLITIQPARYVLFGKPEAPERTAAGDVVVKIGGGRSLRTEHSMFECFVDSSGVIYRTGGYRKPVVAAWSSVEVLIEQLALRAIGQPPPLGRPRLMFTPRIGAAIAAALRATALAECTDRFRAFWDGEGALVADGDAYGAETDDSTRVWPRTMALPVEAIRAAHALDIDARVIVEFSGEDDVCRISRHPAADAPSLASTMPERGVVLRAPEDRDREGWVWLSSKDGQPALEQVRVVRGRIYRRETFTAGDIEVREYTIDLERLRPHLSRRALATLERLQVGRDPSGTCTRAELVEMLERLSLPAYESLLEFEEVAGGLYHERMVFGTYAVIQGFQGGTSSTGQLPLVPIASSAGKLYKMDDRGRIHETDSYVGGSGIVADSWRMFLERYAWSHGQSHATLGQPTLEIAGLFGAFLAERAEADLLEPASDSVERIWETEGITVIERRTLWPEYLVYPSTKVWTTDLDALVSAMEAVHAEDPSAAMQVSSVLLSKPPGRGPMVVEVPLWKPGAKAPTGTLCAYGGPGNYNFVVLTGR